MASSTAYIIILNAKTGVFTLISEKDELTIDKSHKKYEWLQSQETGRVIKISEKGRWNSSNDYEGLYDAVKSLSKSKSESKRSSTKNAESKTRKPKETTTKAKKIKSSRASTSKETKAARQTKEVRLQSEVDKLRKEITSQQAKIKSQEEEIQKKKESAINGWSAATDYQINYKAVLELIGEKDALFKGQCSKGFDKITRQDIREAINRIKGISAAPKTRKPTAPKPKPFAKQYKARITATLSYYHKVQSLYPGKQTELLNIKITTRKFRKKPSQSYFKSYLKLAANTEYYTESMDLGMHIDSVSGLSGLGNHYHYEKFKISSIEFISIEED